MTGLATARFYATSPTLSRHLKCRPTRFRFPPMTIAVGPREPCHRLRVVQTLTMTYAVPKDEFRVTTVLLS